LAVLSITVFDEAIATRSCRAFPWLVLAVLIMGVCTPFNEIWRAATWHHWKPNYHLTLIDVENGEFPAHYVGRLDTTRFTWFIKPPKTILPGNKR
jgi:hypothetical protein